MARQKGRLSFTNAAEAILRKKRTPMHVRDIVDEGLKRGLIQTSGKTPHITMNTSLYQENKKKMKKGEKPRFKRCDSNRWTINRDL